VNTVADSHDASPGDGVCADSLGRCSLRAAIEEADASASGSTVDIKVPKGDYPLVLGTLVVGSVAGSISVQVTGAGSSQTVVRAEKPFRVVTVEASTTVAMGHMTITGGHAGGCGYGGGIYNAGTLTVFDAAIDDNSASAGGGIANAGGSLVVTGSTVEGNNGGGFGGGGIQNGGPQNLPGSVRVVASVISGNRTGDEGGGIFSGQNGRCATTTGGNQAATRCAPTLCPTRVPDSGQLTLEIIDSVVADNKGENGGGGIAAAGPAEVIGSVIEDNSAGGAIGGGLFDVGVVRSSVISGNSAEAGGGVEAFPGLAMTIETSTLSRNHAGAYGGAVDINGSVTIDRSTFADNSAGGYFKGGGAAAILDGGGILRLTDSTVTGNRTIPAGGGAIYNYGGSATLDFDTFSDNPVSLTGGSYTTATGTIFAADPSGPACGHAITETTGYNLSSDRSCGLSLATDLIGVDPKLGDLSRNGGPTQTQRLLVGSPAIDHGGLPSSSGCPLVDQRGVPRPQGPACDIGSFEVRA
jgi:CSLREA domain-containing protein